jgi:hypothetical protein
VAVGPATVISHFAAGNTRTPRPVGIGASSMAMMRTTLGATG